MTGCQTTPESTGQENQAAAIFDEQTSGEALVRSAIQEAKEDDRKVLLLFGANWCPYCRGLHNMLESDPEMSAIVDRAYLVVPIDVGTSGRNRNTRLIDRYRASVFSDGIPAVVVLNAKGDRVGPTEANPWSASDSVAPEQIIRFLNAASGTAP